MRERIERRRVPFAPVRVGWLGRALDRAIAEFAPGWARRRVEARRAHALASHFWGRIQERTSAFELADSGRLRGDNWLTSELDPDSQLRESLKEMRLRAGELYRNDEYFAGAVETTVDNVVGLGLAPQAAIQPIAGVIDEDRARELNDQLEDLFKIWAPRAGADQLSFWEICEQAVRAWLIDGEALVVMSDISEANRPLPLSLELIDAERLETPGGAGDSTAIKLGIERDAQRRRVAYHFRKTHSGDTVDFDPRYDRIDADRVCHLYVAGLVSQSRGWPWPWAAGAGLKDLKQFTEAKLISEQVAACFSAFVKTSVDPVDYAESQATGADGNKRIEDIEPGRIQYLNPGEDIEFGDPSRPGDTLAPFVETRLRGVASALNIPYELLAKNYKGLSYSAGRLALIEGRAGWRRRQERLRVRVLDPIWRRFVREAVIIGAIDLDAATFNEHEQRLGAVNWILPRSEWLDPAKDVAADIQAINENLVTKADVLAARGLDLEETLRQRGREIELERRYGCIPAKAPGTAAAAADDGAAGADDPAADDSVTVPAGEGEAD